MSVVSVIPRLIRPIYGDFGVPFPCVLEEVFHCSFVLKRIKKTILMGLGLERCTHRNILSNIPIPSGTETIPLFSNILFESKQINIPNTLQNCSVRVIFSRYLPELAGSIGYTSCFENEGQAIRYNLICKKIHH
jgi:hypothetical protein